MQREALAQNIWPVENFLGVGDRVVDGAHWLKRHPAVLVAAIVTLAVSRPTRAWRLARRGFVVWQGFRKLRSRLSGIL
ncbi:MAG: hypothetical protein H6R10_1771 [Rhodocyclaceae bacterium]|nr:hypothetical protein [Rhodocyclaceae bacterium]